MALRVVAGSAQQLWVLVFASVLVATAAVAQVGPIGSEFEVTTQTTNSQNFPAIGVSGDGFTIVWSNGNPTSPSPDGDRAGVFGQRFANDGSRRGSEFQVNAYTTGNQRFPAVSVGEDGDFVVVWEGVGAAGTGAQAQRYDANGAKQGTEFLISTDAFAPRVSLQSDGGFVATWWGGNDGGTPVPGGGFGVLARRYDSGGVALGNAFQVNTYTTNLQRNPSIATAANGAFVIVWQSDQDGGNDGIFAQRYSSSGATNGTELQINSYTTGFQTNPVVATDAAGNFVVAWQSADQDGSSYGIFAQRFDSSGARRGSEFRVNTYTQFDQSQPDIDVDGSGGFVITWGSTAQDGEGRGIYAQGFDSAGAPVGTEFRVNTTTAGDEDLPAVGLLGAREFVVTWDAGASGVFAQRFGIATPTVPPSPTPTSTPPGSSCPGDCDGSDAVAVNELVRCVNISLETADVSTCSPCDTDGGGTVTVNELVQAVNAALRGCPS